MHIFYYDENRLYICEDIIDDLAKIPENATDVQPIGFVWPKFNPDTKEWYESASQEVIDSLKPKFEPSEFELVRQQQAELVFTLMMKGVI